MPKPQITKPTFVKAPKDPSTLALGLERLERVIAHLGLASRREAKALIATGKVTVNGKKILESGYGIQTGKDIIAVDGVGSVAKETMLVYKPRGIETSRTTSTVKDILSMLPQFKHLAPIGRLDKDSEGLIIISNDGTLAKALTGVDTKIGKEYLVTVREFVSDQSLQKMRTGIKLDGIPTKPAQATRVSRTSFSIVLYEGRKHQIRRMCDACRLTIESLVRTKIGHLEINTLKPGNFKKIPENDITLLKKL